MSIHLKTKSIIRLCIVFSLCMASPLSAQTPMAQMDSATNDTLQIGQTLPTAGKAVKEFPRKQQRDWSTWRPSPKRAMWLAVVIPGAGQIYNRKYWKLPLVYGGFVGCAYAMRWNNMMYRDYSQAYLDIMDDDPNTQSYNQFLHLGNQITSANEARYKEIFRKRKDRFRRYRDLSFFCLLGVYGLSIVDAYVDATLSEFDISDSLTLHIEPGFINTKQSSAIGLNLMQNNALGVNCSLTF